MGLEWEFMHTQMADHIQTAARESAASAAQREFRRSAPTRRRLALVRRHRAAPVGCLA